MDTRTAIAIGLLMTACAGAQSTTTAPSGDDQTTIPDAPPSAPAPTSAAPSGGSSDAGAASAEPSAQGDGGATAPAARRETLYVHERQVDCRGEGPMRCMQVRRSPDGEWERFYDTIEGFEHSPSHRYQLEVEVTEIAAPMADGPTLRYRLIEVVSEEGVGR